MNGVAWLRDPEGKGKFGPEQQNELLKAALNCCADAPAFDTGEEVSSEQARSRELGKEPPAIVSELDRTRRRFAIAVGTACKRATEWLAAWAALRLAYNVGRSDKWREPAVDTLILVVPALCHKYFQVKDRQYGVGALALEAVGRIVVLVCGRDATASVDNGEPAMGRVGPIAGSDPRVQAIDISPLIESHADAAYGVLCSCEAVGLIRRLAQGVAVDAALLGWAKLLSFSAA